MHAFEPHKVRELLDMARGDVTWVRQLFDLYRDDTRRLLDELTEAVAAGRLAPDRSRPRGDGPRLPDAYSAAHAIKGASSSVGAIAMAGLCQALEDRAVAGDLAGTRAALVRVEAEYARVLAAMPTLLDT